MAKRYKTIVADPPWELSFGPRTHSDEGGWANGSHDGMTSELGYPTMTVDEIAALPVRDLAEPNAHLYLWTINAYLEETWEIARLWGFKPATLLTWCKAPMGLGFGGTFTQATEHVLFARRGVLPALRRMDSNWWQWPRQRQHSRKPEAFLDLVEQVSPGPYLELFARRNRLGWDTWGNESPNHAEVAA